MSATFKAIPYEPVQSGDEFFTLPLSGAGDVPGLLPTVFLSTRMAGSMNYEPQLGNPARDAWISRRGFDPGKALALMLAHSRIVKTAMEPLDLHSVEADGILTASTDGCAVLTVADCMPIFLYDSGTGAFGVLHSGWKGTGILASAFKSLEAVYGTNPADVLLTFGPCIGTCCYPVDEARARGFSEEFGTHAVTVIDGLPRLDLVAANLALAERCGALTVRYTRACTSCDGRMGSFRRQGAENFTRMAACIGFPVKATS